MRSLLATVTFAILLGATAAQAEKRIFIVANNADGYGVDRCLASGAKCGAAAAAAYCKSREFAQATRSARSTRTRSPARSRPTPAPARAATATQFVAIECSR